MKTEHLKEKLGKLESEMQRLAAMEKLMLAFTRPADLADRSRQPLDGDEADEARVTVDTEHHLSITHEVTNTGSDRSQLSHIAKEAQAVLCTDALEAVADRGYFNGEEILACDEVGSL